MKTKFPNLIPILDNNSDLPENHPSKLIHIMGQHAVVTTSSYVVCVNMREYIKREAGIDSPEEIEELNILIDSLEGKSLSKNFWKEFTSSNEITSNPFGIEVTKSFSTKNVIFDTIEGIDLDSIKKIVTKTIKKTKDLSLSKISLAGDSLIKILTSLKELKSDEIIFDFKDDVLRFSGRSKDYIFGVIMLDTEAAQEWVAFDNVEILLDRF